MINRRGILLGLASALAAPAIVHAGNLMPVRALKLDEFVMYLYGRDQFGNEVTERLTMPQAPVTPIQYIGFAAEHTKFAKVDKIVVPVWHADSESFIRPDALSAAQRNKFV